MAGVTPSFQFQVPPASEDTKAPGLLASMAPGGFMDAQKEVSRPRWPIRLEPMPRACLRSSRAAVAAWRRCSCGRLSRRRMRALLASHTLVPLASFLVHSPSLCPSSLVPSLCPCAVCAQGLPGSEWPAESSGTAEGRADALPDRPPGEGARRAITDPIVTLILTLGLTLTLTLTRCAGQTPTRSSSTLASRRGRRRCRNECKSLGRTPSLRLGA